MHHLRPLGKVFVVKGPVPEKIRKLIPLLGLDKDGEVVAAARAIGRALAAAGLDWHDLVAAVFDGDAGLIRFDWEGFDEERRRRRDAGEAQQAAEEAGLNEQERARRAKAAADLARFQEADRKRAERLRQDPVYRANWCLSRQEWLTPEERTFLWSALPLRRSGAGMRLDAQQRQRLDAIFARLEGRERAAEARKASRRQKAAAA